MHIHSFSHERVSVPPVNWTNACHRNGVQCFGTFLVEGNNQMHEMEALLCGPPTLNNTNEDPMQLWSPFYADKLGEYSLIESVTQSTNKYNSCNCETLRFRWLVNQH